jgi:AcrR family transcriptional regulator
VEDAVLGAAIGLLTEEGVERTTMSAVVERSGVARATVYLRWANRQALIAAAIRRAMGRPILAASGDVEVDLRRAAERMRELLESPAFRGVFPAVVASLTRPSAGSDEPIPFQAVAPGLPLILESYRRYAVGQGFRGDVAAETAAALIVGGHIGQYLMTARPPTAAERDQLMEVIFDGLRRREPAAR